MRKTLGLLSILLGLLLVACSGAGMTISFSDEESSVEVANAPVVNTISPNGAMIATVNAAPIREPYPSATPEEVAQVAAETSNTTTVAAAFDPALVEAGSLSYTTYCSACHGMDAKGVNGLGKTLVESEFVRSLSDADLMTFVKTGRPIWDAANTTGIDMPPKGGNPALTDEELANIIIYLRSLDPTHVASAPQEVAAEQPQTTNAAYDPALVEAGGTNYTTYCSSCHGLDGKGVSGLGKDLVNSEFVHSLNDSDLLAFVKTGRPIWDAANTTGIDMPPKGGNPALTDNEILSIIAFLRSQQGG